MRVSESKYVAMPPVAERNPHYPLDNYELADRYRRESGRVLLTGTQALVGSR